MKPVLFQLLHIVHSDTFLGQDFFPTLRSYYERVSRGLMKPSSYSLPRLTVLYPDGSYSTLVFGERFRAKTVLDMDVLRAEVDKIFDDDAKLVKERHEKTIARRKRLGKDVNAKFSFNGDILLKKYGKEGVLKNLIENRQWRWKTVEEIDWAALEKELEKEG